MYVSLLFVATAIVGTYLFASGALTAMFGVSALYDRFEKRTSGGGSILCETAGILLLIFGFVFRATDPFHAVHAMLIGALLAALGVVIRPERERGVSDPLVKRAQVGHYRAALTCLATLALFHTVGPLVQ